MGKWQGPPARLWVLAVLVGAAAASTTADFEYKTFTGAKDVAIDLMARLDPKTGFVILTGDGLRQFGTLWHTKQVPLAGFDTTFTFSIPPPSKTKKPGPDHDGLAFLISGATLDDYGSYNGGMGYAALAPYPQVVGPTSRGPGGVSVVAPGNPGAGIAKSVAIEFDLFKESAFCDYDPPHISVHSNGTAFNRCDERYNVGHVGGAECSMAAQAGNPCFYHRGLHYFNDGLPHTARIAYVPDKKTPMLNVWYDESPTPVIECPVANIAKWLGVDPVKGKALFGFSASTSGSGGTPHIVQSWSWLFAGASDASKSKAAGAGLQTGTAGVEGKFVITAVNQWGNQQPVGGEKWTVDVTGAGSVKPKVVDNDDGTYSVSYTPIKAGKAHISISVAGKEMGEGYSIQIKTGPLDPSSCKATGTAVGGTGTVAVPLSLTVTSQDKEGNVIDKGGADAKVIVTGPEGDLEPPVKDNGDGTYTSNFVRKKSGAYTVDVRLNKESVKGSPFKLKLAPGKTEPLHCKATGPGVTGAIAGEETDFLVTTYDQYDNPIGKSTDVVTVAMSSAAIVPKVKPGKKDGTYGVKYSTTIAGKYQMEVDVNGQSILDPGKRFPLRVVAAKMDPRQTATVGEGVTHSTANTLSIFRLETRDRFLNPLPKGGHHFTGWVFNGAGKVPVAVKDPDTGVYEATYQSTRKGFASLFVYHTDAAGNEFIPVPGCCPFNVTVRAGPAYAPNCKVDGPGRNGAESDKETWIAVHAHDYTGNEKTYGGDTVTIKLLQMDGTPYPEGSVLFRVDDLNNGTYQVFFTPQQNGDMKLDVIVNELHAGGAPFHLFVSWSGLPVSTQLIIGGTCAVAVIGILVGTARAKNRVKRRARAMTYQPEPYQSIPGEHEGYHPLPGEPAPYHTPHSGAGGYAVPHRGYQHVPPHQQQQYHHAQQQQQHHHHHAGGGYQDDLPQPRRPGEYFLPGRY